MTPRRNRAYVQMAQVLGRRLRRLRADRGMTQRDAAARIGVGPSVLRRMETGRANPSLAVLLSVARAFGVSLHLLLRRR